MNASKKKNRNKENWSWLGETINIYSFKQLKDSEIKFTSSFIEYFKIYKSLFKIQNLSTKIKRIKILFRDNRKGRILKRNQIQCLKRAAAAGRATGEPAFKLIKTGESLKPGESRLKPPPKVFCSGDAKNSGPANGTNNGLTPGGGEARGRCEWRCVQSRGEQPQSRKE